MTTGFLYRKATQALNYFAILEGGSINKMKALKLIWLSDRFQVRKYGRLIFNDTYFALKNGTVASTTKNLAYAASDFLETEEQEYSNKYITPVGEYDYSSVAPVDLMVFSKAEIATLDFIYKTFGHLDQYQLSELSHDYPEWAKYKEYFKSKSSARFEIDTEDFFKNPDSNNHEIFVQTDKFIESSKEYFLNACADC